MLANAQPLLIDYRGGPLTIAHNGNLTNAPELRRELADQGAIFTTTTDTEVLLHLIARSRKHTPEEQIREALEQAEGAYTLLMSVGRTIYAVIDSRGFRPAVLGRLGGGVVIASETCALDLVGAQMVCEMEPGQFLKFEEGQITELPRLRPRPISRCVFELVYFARPDSRVLRRVGGPGAARAGPRAGAGAPYPGRRGGVQRSGQRQRDGARFCRGLRDQAGERADQEPLRGPDLHQSDPGVAGRQGEDQVQSGARRDRGPLGGDGGRQPGPRNHQQGAGADDPRRGRPRSAPEARALRRSPAPATTGSTRRPARS